MPKAMVQTTARFEPALYEAIDAAAKKAGIPINTWLIQAAQEKLEREKANGRH